MLGKQKKFQYIGKISKSIDMFLFLIIIALCSGTVKLQKIKTIFSPIKARRSESMYTIQPSKKPYSKGKGVAMQVIAQMFKLIEKNKPLILVKKKTGWQGGDVHVHKAKSFNNS